MHIYIYVIDANVWRLCRIRQHSEIGIINPAFRINNFESPPCKIRSSTTEVSAMKWRIQIYECCNSGRNIHVDQIPRRVCSIWSLTFSTSLADFQPWRQMSATALQALQAPDTEGIHTQSENMWIFHNFPAVVSEAVRTCPRLLHNHIHQNHRKSVWLVGLPMGYLCGLLACPWV